MSTNDSDDFKCTICGSTVGRKDRVCSVCGSKLEQVITQASKGSDDPEAQSPSFRNVVLWLIIGLVFMLLFNRLQSRSKPEEMRSDFDHSSTAD